MDHNFRSKVEYIKYYKALASCNDRQLKSIENFGFSESKNYFESDILNVNSHHIDIFNFELFNEKVSEDHFVRKQNLNYLYLAKIPTHYISLKEKIESFGFKTMDTIVYHIWTKDKLLDLGSNRNKKIRFAKQHEAIDVSKISQKAFADTNRINTRFSNDNMVTRDHIEKIYFKWAYESVKKNFADDVLVYLEKGKVVGFLAFKTFKISKNNKLTMIGEITLNAVLLAHSRKGIYGQMLLSALQHLANNGCEFVIIATQSNNYAVHKACSNTGSYLDSITSSYHLWIKD